MKLEYHPTLFRLLEMLEYKSILLKQNKNQLYEKYEARITEIMKMVDSKTVDKVFPEEEHLKKWQSEITYIES